MKNFTLALSLSLLWSSGAYSNQEPTTSIGKNAKVDAKIVGGVIATVNGSGEICTKVAAISNTHVRKNAEVNVKILGGVANTVIGKGKSTLIVGSIGGFAKGACKK